MTDIALAAASRAQLEHYARNVLNIVFSANWKDDTLRARIMDAGGADMIPAEMPDPLAAPVSHSAAHPVAHPVTRSAPEGDGDGASVSHVELTIHREKGEQDRVPLYCNGTRFDVPRGKKVVIPIRFYQILENAKKTEFSRGDAVNEAAIGEASDVYRFPFSVHRMISKAG